MQAAIKNTKDNTLNYLIGCRNVYETVEYVEARVCKDGMNWSYKLVSSYTWFCLIIFLVSFAINRMKPLVEKKKSEIEVYNFIYSLGNVE